MFPPLKKMDGVELATRYLILFTLHAVRTFCVPTTFTLWNTGWGRNGPTAAAMWNTASTLEKALTTVVSSEMSPKQYSIFASCS